MSASPQPDLSEAARLLHAGFRLCKLKPNLKEPEGEGWNLRPVKHIDPKATGYGLILAPNKLCSIDPDKWREACIGMRALGFDLEQIMAAGVRTRSTRPGSGGRSAFAAEGEISWLKFRSKETGTVLELRAHSENLQDCIPGIVYQTKDGEICTQTYANGRRLDDAPALPDDLFAWWERCSTDIDFLREQEARFFAAIGAAPYLSVSTGRKGDRLAFDAPGVRGTFNAMHKVEDILKRHGYGYDKKTRRWYPPTATGAPGVRPIPDKDGLWRSDHASDPLSGTFDAWVAHVVLDRGGDLSAAIEQFRKDHPMLGNQAPPNVDPTDEQIEAPELRYVTGDMLDITDRTFDDELIEGFLGKSALAVLYGDSNSGKTFLAIDIAACVERSAQWMGRNTDGGLVLYLATEAVASVELRVAAYRKKHGVKLAGFVVVRSPINLFDAKADVSKVVALARHHERRTGRKVALVVGDTLARIAAGANENAGEDMGVVMRNADAIREALQASFLWIHHTGKDAAKGMRGWSGMRAAIDTEIEVTADEATGQRCAEVTKQRDIPGKGERIGFRLESVPMGHNKWGTERNTCICICIDAPAKVTKGKRPSAIAGAIEVFLRQRGSGMKRGELQKTLSSAPYTWSFGGVRNEIAAMVKDGRLLHTAGIVALPSA